MALDLKLAMEVAESNAGLGGLGAETAALAASLPEGPQLRGPAQGLAIGVGCPGREGGTWSPDGCVKRSIRFRELLGAPVRGWR